MNERALPAKEILAQNLKAYRIFFNLSQLEMARRTHMSYRGYGKLERLEVAASIDTLDKLSAGLGLSPALLLCQEMINCMPHKLPEEPVEFVDDIDTCEE